MMKKSTFGANLPIDNEPTEAAEEKAADDAE